jgi:SAM-dependent methyltransferase
MTTAARAYWDRGVRNVPDMTGAANLMDGADLVRICADRGIDLPLPNVLDVGCGTGRIAQHCSGYLGVDIAPSAIAYCAEQGLDARVIDGPLSLPHLRFEWITCLSVFTHIEPDERFDYLEAFASRARFVLVDIIPGAEEGGSVALWTVPPSNFQADLGAAGFAIHGWAEYRWPGGRHHEGHTHRYYHVEVVR